MDTNNKFYKEARRTGIFFLLGFWSLYKSFENMTLFLTKQKQKILYPLTAFIPPRRVAEFAGLSIRKSGKTGEFFSWISGLLIIFISAFSVVSAMKKTAESG